MHFFVTFVFFVVKKILNLVSTETVVTRGINWTMIKYKISIYVTALIISIPSLFFFFIGVVTISMKHLLFWGGMLTLWWGTYLYLLQGNKRAFWISFVLINLFWWPILLRTVSRIIFIIENGGMERADGYGSPLAFLIGVIGEQLFFLPLCFSMLFGIMALKKLNKTIIQAGR